jgi:uncharacterized FlaG/YvyC family protein
LIGPIRRYFIKDLLVSLDTTNRKLEISLKEVVMEFGSVSTIHPAITAAQPVADEQKVENRKLIKAVKALNATELFGQNNELTFMLDRETRRPLVRIVNRETREVVRQIPAEHALRMANDLHVYS